MVLQEKLVDFDNPTIVLQPANVVALFFQRAKDAAEAVEDDYAAADKGPAFERRRRNSRRRHSLRKRRRSSSRRRRSIRKRRQSKHSDKTNLPKHGPPVRKSRCNAPSSGKRVRKQPIVRHFQGRLSGREPRSHEFAPVGVSRRSWTIYSYLATFLERSVSSRKGNSLVQVGRRGRQN